MPLYRYRCPIESCDTEYDDVYFRLEKHQERILDWCPRHGHQIFEQAWTASGIEDWGSEGPEGRYFEHLSHTGQRFPDKRSYKEYLKKNGFIEWSPPRGMPGCDF